jgi:hypothetical protein
MNKKSNNKMNNLEKSVNDAFAALSCSSELHALRHRILILDKELVELNSKIVAKESLVNNIIFMVMNGTREEVEAAINKYRNNK